MPGARLNNRFADTAASEITGQSCPMPVISLYVSDSSATALQQGRDGGGNDRLGARTEHCRHSRSSSWTTAQPDDGAARVRAFDDPRIMVSVQPNAGVAAARTRALAAAQCPLVAFLDADDIWLPDHLQHLLELSLRFPQAALFGNRFVEFSAHDVPAAPRRPPTYRLLDYFFAAWAYGPQPFFTSSCMVRRDDALAAGGFPAGHSRGEDLALWIELAARHPVAVSSYIGCGYRRGADALTARLVTEPDISMGTLDHLIAEYPGWTPAASAPRARVLLPHRARPLPRRPAGGRYGDRAAISRSRKRHRGAAYALVAGADPCRDAATAPRPCIWCRGQTLKCMRRPAEVADELRWVLRLGTSAAFRRNRETWAMLPGSPNLISSGRSGVCQNRRRTGRAECYTSG